MVLLPPRDFATYWFENATGAGRARAAGRRLRNALMNRTMHGTSPGRLFPMGVHQEFSSVWRMKEVHVGVLT